MRRLRRVTTFPLLVLLAFAACSPAASPAPSPGGPAGWVPKTAWERAVSAIDENGQFSKDAALTLFATAYGPLPGVDVQQDLTGVFSRSIAIRAVERYRDELPTEQQAAVDRYLAPPADAVTIVIPPVAQSSSIRLAAADPGIAAAIRELAEQSRRDIAAHLGRDFIGDHTITFIPRPADVKPIDGLYPNGGTHGVYDGGVFGGCATAIYDEATTMTGVQISALIAHETFHCFQQDGYRLIQPEKDAPAWVIEGQATWVGMELGGPSPNYDRFWAKYLTAPTIPLTTRAYDAVGFYGHLAESGIDPWTVFQAQWAAGTDNIGIYKAARADEDTFADSWASGVLRQPARGAAWDTTGPGITADRYDPPQNVLAAGDQIDLGTAFFTNNIRSIAIQADLLHVRVVGHGRLSDGSLDTIALDDVWFCVAGSDCSKPCPDGNDPPATQGTVGSQVMIATSGSWDGTVGVAEGLDLEEACKSPPPSQPPSPRPTFEPSAPDRAPCQSRCGESNGDVHVATFGDYDYDFQGVGEFVLARSADGAFEVQVRQAAREGTSNVSINTAVAVRAGEHRVALSLGQADTPLRPTVDGAPASASAPTRFGTGGLLAPYERGYRIETGDGSFVYVIDGGAKGLNLLIEPGPARLAGIVGLAGYSPEGSRYPALPDGSGLLPFKADRHTDYQQLYVTLADAWRVDQSSSLFDYEPGASTETFTRRAFPAEADLVALEDLDQSQLAAGEAACSGIADPELHEMCVYDVGVTADPGYGDLYETHVTLLETGSLGQSGERARVVNLYANKGQGVALDVYAWAGYAQDERTAAPALVATVPYGAASAWFNPGEMANGQGSVNRISVQRSGEPVNPFQFNLYDLARDSNAGADRTIVISNGASDVVSPGGDAAAYGELYEVAPDGLPLLDPPPGKALVFLDIQSLYHQANERTFLVSDGGRCLSSPDFPTLPQAVQGTEPRPLQLEPGAHDLALHDVTGVADVYGFQCAGAAVAAQARVDLEAGGRAHLFVYAIPGSTDIRTLVVPFGR